MPLHSITTIAPNLSEDDLESSLKQQMLEYQGGEDRSTHPSFNILSDQAPNLPCDAEARCVITHKPSIIEVIQTSSNRPEAIDNLMLMPDSQIADAARFNELLSTARSEFIKSSTKQTVCERLYDKLRSFTYKGEIETRDYIRVPVAELHCPQTQNCSTKYQWSNSKTAETSFAVTLAGCQIGGGATLTVTTSKSLAAIGKCLMVSKLCRVAIKTWQNKEGKLVTAPRLLSVADGLVTTVLHGKMKNHFCTQEFDKVKKVIKSFSSDRSYYAHCLPFSLSKNSMTEETTTIRKGLIVDIKNEIKLDEIGLPILIELSIKSHVEDEFGYEINLEGGYDYLGFYRGKNSSSYMWAWRQNGVG